MQRSAIEYFSGYPMLGYYDGLVRFWATDREYTKFLTVCNESLMGLSTTRTLIASSIHYTWHGRSNAEQESELLQSGPVSVERDHDIRAMITSIEDVARSGNGMVDVEAVRQEYERLVSKRLLLYKSAETAANIKVFILLQPIGDFRDRAEVTKSLLVMRRSSAHFQNMSLYAGEGTLGTHLVRLTVESFDDILRATNELDHSLENLQYRTTTLFVGVQDVDETDNINNLNRLTNDEYDLANRLDVSKTLIGYLNPQSRAWLVDQYNAVTTRVESIDVIETSLEILTAALKRDRNALRGKLSFVVDLEFYFRQFVVNVLSEAYKLDWIPDVHERIPNPFRNMTENDARNPGKWPLGVVLQVLRESCRNEAYIDARVTEALGEDWYGLIRPVFDVRNEFAHGRLINEVDDDDLNDFSGQWGQNLKDIIRALPLHSALYKNSSDAYFRKGKE